MKSNSFLVLACLVAMPVFAQSLPDEINYAPYETRFEGLSRDTRNAEAKLGESRESLAQTRKFIAEMTSHIASLEANIRESENEIARLRREIPELEGQISYMQRERSRLEGEIRARQMEDSNLTYRHQEAVRTLRPLEDSLDRKERRLRELQNELSQYQRALDAAASRYNQTVNEANRIDRAFEQERNSQRQMEQELRTVESRISSMQAEMGRIQGAISSLESDANTLRSRLASLDPEVSRLQSELARLRAANAPAAEIQAVQRQISTVMSQRNTISNSIRNIESQINRERSRISTLNNQIEGIRRDQASLPGRIAQSESRQRQLESQRAGLEGQLHRYQREVEEARRNYEVRSRAVEGQRDEVRREEMQVNRQRQVVEDYVREINRVRGEINRLSSESQNLSRDIAEASEQVRANQVAIPQFEAQIREDQGEIRKGESELAEARTDEGAFENQVARDESKLAEVTRARDAAELEMNNRLSLYRHYENEALEIGSAQADTGIALGEKEGQRLSNVLSKSNGQSVGRELGVAEAKYWGSVRGEIQGYEEGYVLGLSSTPDRTRAVSEASSKAALDAELFAQTNFKPVFFEEHVQAQFKKPLSKLPLVMKALSSLQMNLIRERSLDRVDPLTSEEIARSAELQTPLDGNIAQFTKDVSVVEAKARRLGQAEVAFPRPTKIPFGTASCSKVYKGLAVFKAACEGSYKSTFTNNYVSAAQDSFGVSYPKQYQSELDAVNVSEREAKFHGELALASKVGHAEGLRVGKIEIYQTTYASTYKSVYETELVKARSKAKDDAAHELSTFLKNKPLLTLSESRLEAESFRGNEEVSFLGKLKNVGQVALTGPAMVRITEVVNGEKVKGEVVVNSAAPLAVTDVPALKVKVASTAKAGEKLIVRGTVDLPGDLYRPSRQEKFELTQVLSANPAYVSSLKYDNTPDIKGIFSRYIHFLDVKVQPTVDNVQEGYEVSLTALGETASTIELKEKELKTGSIALGSSKEVRFSYTFKDSAKDKTVNLEITTKYLGKVIKKETITLKPH